MEMVEEASRESVSSSKSSRGGYLMEMVEETSRESVRVASLVEEVI